MHDGDAVFVIPALDSPHAFQIARRLAFGKKHLQQYSADENQIDRLLSDGVPGIDAVECDYIENKAGGERGDVDGVLVAFVIELEPFEARSRGWRFTQVT